MKTNEVYLRHILDAIQHIESYTAEVDRQAFKEDRMLQDAVVRQVEIIGDENRRRARGSLSFSS